MYIEDVLKKGNQEFQLTFTTPYLYKSENDLSTNNGPTLTITENYGVHVPEIY